MISAFTVNALFQLAAPVKGALNDYGNNSLHQSQEFIFMKVCFLLEYRDSTSINTKNSLRLQWLVLLVTVSLTLNFY